MAYTVHIYNPEGVELAFRPMETIREAQTFATAHVRSLHSGCYAQVRGWKDALIMDTRNAQEATPRDDH